MKIMVEEKSPKDSKTLWTNAISMIIVALTFLLDHEMVRDNVNLILYFTVAINVLNIVLRFITSQPLRFTTMFKSNSNP